MTKRLRLKSVQRLRVKERMTKRLQRELVVLSKEDIVG